MGSQSTKGPGENERLIAQAIKEQKLDRSKIFIATKVGQPTLRIVLVVFAIERVNILDSSPWDLTKTGASTSEEILNT